MSTSLSPQRNEVSNHDRWTYSLAKSYIWFVNHHHNFRKPHINTKCNLLGQPCHVHPLSPTFIARKLYCSLSCLVPSIRWRLLIVDSFPSSLTVLTRCSRPPSYQCRSSLFTKLFHSPDFFTSFPLLLNCIICRLLQKSVNGFTSGLALLYFFKGW